MVCLRFGFSSDENGFGCRCCEYSDGSGGVENGVVLVLGLGSCESFGELKRFESVSTLLVNSGYLTTGCCLIENMAVPSHCSLAFLTNRL